MKQLHGFTARIFQHEDDHLKGICFGDRIIQEGGKLHWVELDEYPDYRKNWATWQRNCPLELWEAMKADQPYEPPTKAG